MPTLPVAFLHYTAPPVVGGVEAVMEAHARVFLEVGIPVTLIAGQGDASALPPGADLALIPELDTRHPEIQAVGAELEAGRVPAGWDELVGRLEAVLRPILAGFSTVIFHNVFSKHFNLPLTAAIARLLDQRAVHPGIAWCHDFTWTSPRSADQVHPGYPWDLLRVPHPALRYVTVSQARQLELAGLFGCPPELIRVVYNGVDPGRLLRLGAEAQDLAARLDLLDSDLFLLLPVRVTRAKNLELAIRVAAALSQRFARPRLVVTGPPDPHSRESMGYFDSLRELRRQLGVEPVFRFVFESGPDPAQPHWISQEAVGDLMRLCDVVFLTSQGGEGFGMPVLEAGFMGIPVTGSRSLPAMMEVGGSEVFSFDDQGVQPEALAAQLSDWLEGLPSVRFRRRVRADFTWRSIFERDIRPMLAGGSEP